MLPLTGRLFLAIITYQHTCCTSTFSFRFSSSSITRLISILAMPFHLSTTYWWLGVYAAPFSIWISERLIPHSKCWSKYSQPPSTWHIEGFPPVYDLHALSAFSQSTPVLPHTGIITEYLLKWSIMCWNTYLIPPIFNSKLSIDAIWLRSHYILPRLVVGLRGFCAYRRHWGQFAHKPWYQVIVHASNPAFLSTKSYLFWPCPNVWCSFVTKRDRFSGVIVFVSLYLF